MLHRKEYKQEQLGQNLGCSSDKMTKGKLTKKLISIQVW